MVGLRECMIFIQTKEGKGEVKVILIKIDGVLDIMIYKYLSCIESYTVGIQ